MKVRPGGETRHEFMQRVESNRGLSISKSGRRDLRVHREPPPPTNIYTLPPPNNQNTFFTA